MKVIPTKKTCRVHNVSYLRFYFRICKIFFFTEKQSFCLSAENN